MVLETWATDFSIGNHQQMFIAQDNPVQRRPKIDYFNNETVQNMIPIVSHISSNGYYGYCATPTMPTSNHVDNGIDKPSIEDDEKIQMDIQMILQPPNDHVNHGLAGSVERRKRCQKFMHDDQAIATKRCRNQIEIGEDRSIVFAHNTSHQSTFPVAPTEEVFFTVSSNPPNNGNNFINHMYIDSIGPVPFDSSSSLLPIVNTTTGGDAFNQSSACCQQSSAYTSTMSSHMI